MSKLKEHNSSWTFITPIFGLKLTEAVDNEFSIERVTFITATKLRKIRNRLGVKKQYLKKIGRRHKLTSFIDDFLSKYETFAILQQNGKPEEIKAECYRKVQDEISILALSQLGYGKRRYTGFVGLAGEHDRSASSHIFLDSQEPQFILGNQLLRSPTSLVLEERWKGFQDQKILFRLLKILNNKVKVTSKWRNDLRRAAILIGKSINSNDIATSFLWNMIALELLTTHQGDKYSTALPNRIEALIGWHYKWIAENYEDKIQQVYKLRCEYVHDGDDSRISKKMLLFTDKLVFNVLWNLVKHSSNFGSKNEFIDFASRVQARKTLGSQRLTNPKLRFFDIRYTQKDLKEV